MPPPSPREDIVVPSRDSEEEYDSYVGDVARHGMSPSLGCVEGGAMGGGSTMTERSMGEGLSAQVNTDE